MFKPNPLFHIKNRNENQLNFSIFDGGQRHNNYEVQWFLFWYKKD